ncbi:MAG: ACT domain-containing protein, partial [Deltaproteobacteria bacterium]|nr:ACT domain-containing protein [Deltaproteobacteria bacterium]
MSVAAQPSAIKVTPSESYSITMRVEIQNKPGMLGKVTTAIGIAGGDIGAVDLSGHGKGTVTRDITVRARGIDHAQEIITAVRQVQGIRIVNVSDRTFLK